MNGRKRHIHEYYRSSLWDVIPHKRIADFHRVTVVRDPVERFLSAYGNRVIHHRELSPRKTGPKFKNRGLEHNPDLDLFIDRFEEYYGASGPIHHHMRPMVDFVGDDPSYFSKVYKIGDVDDFVADVGEHVGAALTIGRHQTGGRKFRKEDLSPAQLAKMESFYHADYEAFGNYL
ncbi:sulfotransferase family 2 domain-containing protein [Oceaniglobus indicus]|uniref:sulfotransferase family 2 domain-containing protein n=1 Tax=Oceaniglobus indicus TaxID=2047749 RepID=UPI0013044799|nr:sulfotransferase family 2 domain-containing protein [Oceaniglobus indicus]